jgi:hypothetical protein
VLQTRISPGDSTSYRVLIALSISHSFDAGTGGGLFFSAASRRLAANLAPLFCVQHFTSEIIMLQSAPTGSDGQLRSRSAKRPAMQQKIPLIDDLMALIFQLLCVSTRTWFVFPAKLRRGFLRQFFHSLREHFVNIAETIMFRGVPVFTARETVPMLALCLHTVSRCPGACGQIIDSFFRHNSRRRLVSFECSSALPEQ